MVAMGSWSGTDPGTAATTVERPSLRKVAEVKDDNDLLSAHLGAGLLRVIDLKRNAVVGIIRDVPGQTPVKAWMNV